MRIDVAFTPGTPDDAAVAVVIDVLRATTTIAYALEQGYQRVLACGELDQARELARRVNGGVVLAGERKCVKPEGFDLGNSPREFEGDRLGDTLVITTTNGTRAIVTAAAHAQTVAIGSLANLTACAARVGRLAREAQGDVLIQCAGVKGAFTMDDAYTAGRFVQELAVWLSEWERSDAAGAAEAISGSFESGGDGLAASKSARNLRAADLYDDVRFCARESTLDVVPMVADVDAGVALITV
jgi:2-phosphosulfolactate phosphatase